MCKVPAILKDLNTIIPDKIKGTDIKKPREMRSVRKLKLLLL